MSRIPKDEFKELLRDTIENLNKIEQASLQYLTRGAIDMQLRITKFRGILQIILDKLEEKR